MSFFSELLREKKTVLTVEVTPPRGADAHSVIERVRKLVGVADGIDVTSCPMANLHMNAISFGHLLSTELGIEVLVNITTRDRNILGIQSELLGAHALGLPNLIALKGDRMSTGEYEGCKEIYEVGTLGLLQIINKLNNGLDSNGNKLNGKTDFFTGSVLNPNNKASKQTLAERLKKRIEHHAEFFFTQPVYSIEGLDNFRSVVQELNVPIIFGVLPIKSLKMAEKINHDLPGVSIPQDMMNRIEKYSDADVKQFGIEQSLEIMGALKDDFAGFHLMTAGDLAYAKTIIEKFKQLN